MTGRAKLRRLAGCVLLALGASACATPGGGAGAGPGEPARPAEAPQIGENPLLGAWQMMPTETEQGWIDHIGLDRLRFTREAMVKRDQAVPVRYTVQGAFVLVRADMGEFYVYEVLAADRVCLQGIGLVAADQDADPGPSPERVCYDRV